MNKSKVKVTAAEMVSLVSGMNISGAQWADIYRKVANLLKASKEFEYAYYAGLKENLIRYAKGRGFSSKLEEASVQYVSYLKKGKPSTHTNTCAVAQNLAIYAGVPAEITIL